ncbi:stalk domain-containing protein [Paenibacillus sp. N3.4]|uniref:stalk domain-containing protein n=1 Tax=Paenibacillus sp. N3.4 TaxID=2603222 RepID=UPI0011C794C4|nr:stalk domain-containing protein [Paenibacillus sp. N3.4]TXK75437.1 hypothetical protein FU659_27510 [Paenibacillus sp. N3.4]
MIRKTLASFVCMAIAVPSIALADTQKPISVFVDGQQLAFEVAPIIQDGTTLVPIRAVFEKLGLKVTWDSNTNTITGIKDGLNIQMKIGDTNAVLNGKATTLEVPPNIIDGNTLVPLRFVGEASGNEIAWDGDLRKVSITSKKQVPQGELYAQGAKYVGDIVNGKANGKGIFTTNGTKYEGEFKDNFPDGTGVYTFSDGGKYEGELKHGNFYGKGTLTLKDGSKYVGMFKDGKRNGEGKLYDPSGRFTATGMFKDDVLVSQSTAEESSTSTSTGADAVLASIQAKFSSITLGSKTLHFTYQMPQIALPQNGEMRIMATISNDDYLDFLEVLLNNKSDLQNGLQSLVNELNEVTKKNGVNSYFLDAFYQKRYSFYPTSYKPTEISINSDGTVTVTHSIFTIFKGQLNLK